MRRGLCDYLNPVSEKEAGFLYLETQPAEIINSLIIMMILIHKIPPNLPLQREEVPLFGKEGLALLNSGHTSRLKEAI
jgi:hypothetical protein